MKNLILLLTLALGVMSFKQDKVQSATIQTSAECGSCKERIEEKLNYTKGIVYSNLDVPTKVLTVKFKTEKISLDEIKKIVSELGYDADDIKANHEKQLKLPKCCQPGGMH
jgi:periplasmic mercuric ion binding protein